MVSFTTTTLAAFTVLVTLQPVLGGPLLSVFGGGKKRDLEGNFRGTNFIFSRDETLEADLTHCISAAHSAPITAVAGKTAGSILLSSLPKSCIDEVNKYNKLPNIASLNKVQGKATVKGPDSVLIENLPKAYYDQVQALAGSGAAAPAATGVTTPAAPKGAAAAAPKPAGKKVAA